MPLSRRNIALFDAASAGDMKRLETQVQRGVNVNIVDDERWTPLHASADKGHVDAVRLLLKAGADPDAADRDGWTPIHLAARNGHHQVIQVLVRHDAHVDVRTKFGNRTALYWAAEKGHVDAVKTLIKLGADVTAQDEDGQTAVHVATSFGHTDVVDLLKVHDVQDAKAAVKALNLKELVRFQDAMEVLTDPNLSDAFEYVRRLSPEQRVQFIRWLRKR